MTEQEWLEGTELEAMLAFLRGRASERQLRLFACGCCRRVWKLVRHAACRRAVETSEDYADGRATAAQRRAAERRAREATDLLASEAHITLRLAKYAERDACRAAVLCAEQRLLAPQVWAQVRAAVAATPQPLSDPGTLLRDIVSNPFRPVSAHPAWRTPTVAQLAETAYAERELPSGHLDPARLAVLADALEAAGCDNEDVLAHLNAPGPHVRGCWAVDLLLGKE